MKKSILMITLSLIAISGYSFIGKSTVLKEPFPAIDPFSFNIKLQQVQDSQKIRVVFEKPLNKSLLVTLKDPDGNEMIRYIVNVKANIIYQDFNFKGADQGIYNLEISDRTKKVIKQINFQRIRLEEIEKLTVN